MGVPVIAWKSTHNWLQRKIADLKDEIDLAEYDEENDSDYAGWGHSTWRLQELEVELTKYEAEYSELCILFESHGYNSLNALLDDAKLMFEWSVDPRMPLYKFEDFERVRSILKAMNHTIETPWDERWLDNIMDYPLFSTEEDVRKALRYMGSVR